MFKFSKSKLYRHLIIWLGLMFYIYFSEQVNGGSPGSNIIFVLLSILNFSISYYLLLHVVFINYFEKNKVIFIVYFFAIIVLFVSIDYLNYKVLLPLLGGNTHGTTQTYFEFIKNSFLLFSYIAFASLGAYLNWRGFHRIKENSEKEKMVISRELNFLKNQFHSHLTFNFLNYCYGKMLRYAPKSSEAVTSFSEMLRYSLRGEHLETYVPLANEIEYIENFIVIQKCISSNVNIQFYVEGDISKFNILPMILSVFVENAFKHGVFNNPEKPIKITLSVQNESLFFCVNNNKANITAISSTGVGLTNIIHLLTMFYTNTHKLNIKESESNYCTELTLNLISIP